nr:elongation factor Ts [Hymenolepis microstoma]
MVEVNASIPMGPNPTSCTMLHSTQEDGWKGPPRGGGLVIAYCHMSNAGVKKGFSNVVFGKYIAVLRYRHINNQEGSVAWQEQASRFTQQMCQRIVGMNQHRNLSPQAENPDGEKCLLRQPLVFYESVAV